MRRARKLRGRLGTQVVFRRRPALHPRVLAAHKVVAAIIRAGLVRVRLALLAEAGTVAGRLAVLEAVVITAVAAITAVALVPEAAVVVGTQRPAALAERTAANLTECLIS
jgi:hypothetical protein